MATDVEALLLTIEANTKKLEKDMAKANAIFAKQAAEMKRKADELNKSLGIKGIALGGLDALGSRLKGLLSTFVAMASVGSAFNLVREIADLADQSAKIGVTAEELQAVQFAGKLAGTGIEEVNGALIKFSKNAGGADEESSKLAQIFKENGVSMTDASGRLRPLTELVKDFSIIVDKAANDQDAAALATVGFGKAGSAMVPLIRQMAGGFDSMGEAARAAGAIVENDLVNRADKFDDAWTAALTRVKAGIGSLILELSKDRPFNRFQSDWAAGLKSLDAPKLYDALRPPGEVLLPSEKDLDAFKVAKDKMAAILEKGQTSLDASDVEKFYRAMERRSKAPPPAGAGSSGESLDELEREIRAITEKGEALAVEISMVGKSTEEREKALEMQKLKTAADRAEIELTPEKLAQLDAIASAYARDVAQLEKVKKGHEDAARAAEHLGETAADAMADIILDGKNAGEVIQNLVKSLARAALQAALMGSGPLGGLFGGGLLKGAFSSLFGGGAGGAPMTVTPFATGGVVTKPTLSLSGEAGPEAFVPLQGGRIPVSLRLPAARDMIPRNGGTTQVVFSPVIDARGAEAGAVARIERGLKDLAASMPRQFANFQRMRDVRNVVPR